MQTFKQSQLSKSIADLGIMLITAIGTLMGYIFNVVLVNYAGPIAFGEFSTLVSIIIITCLPTSILNLAVAQYIRKSRFDPNVQKKIVRIITIIGVTTGLLLWCTHSLWETPYVINHPYSVVVVALIAVPTYLNPLFYSILLGRSLYTHATLLLPLPNILKFICVIAMFIIFPISRNVLGGLLGMGIAVWLTTITSFWIVKKSKFTKRDVHANSMSIWASGGLTTVTNIWLSVDVILISKLFPLNELALWAAISIVGKLPLFLTSPVINNEIMKNLKYPLKRTIWLLIIIFSIGIMISATFAPKILTIMFGFEIPQLELTLYLLGNMFLTFSYLFAGVSASNGVHKWWLFIPPLLLWSLLMTVHLWSFQQALIGFTLANGLVLLLILTAKNKIL